jgi:hypothetical protein
MQRATTKENNQEPTKHTPKAALYSLTTLFTYPPYTYTHGDEEEASKRHLGPP